MMRVVFDDATDTWWSVTLVDEFWGHEMIVETASAPQGPWTMVATVTPPPSHETPMVSYHPTILNVDGCELTVAVSRNAADWPAAIENPELYRPRVIGVDACGAES